MQYNPLRCYRITESQNHSMVGVGRDLCGSSSPTPLPKQGHLQEAVQDLVQVGLEYLQKRRMHNLSGQPVVVVVLVPILGLSDLLFRTKTL